MHAISYHIQIADNPLFTSPIDNATTQDTFFTMTNNLKPATRYYWRVQAIFGDSAGFYVTNMFTTLESPE